MNKGSPKKVIEISNSISVKELSEKTRIPVIKIIGELMKNGVIATINQKIDFETASIITSELGIEIAKEYGASSVKDLVEGDLKEILKKDEGKKKTRPPVVTIMGHVDHGKTKLLDYIRKANIVATESGGITQHIGAYIAESNGKKITFIDTPGHEAFTEMRSRGAKVTDIAILVVAADEGIKPQTEEAISHAKEAGVPIIVALNKIDKKNADIDKVKGELANFGLQSEDWGGDTIMVPVSAMTGEGVDVLLEMISLVAEMENLEANFDRPAIGTVIESNYLPGIGIIATVLVKAGKLKMGDNFVVGDVYGRVRIMHDHNKKKVKEATPSVPVEVASFSGVPEVGNIFEVMENEKAAKERAEKVANLRKEIKDKETGSIDIFNKIKNKDIKELKIILKADTRGTLEAIKGSIEKIKEKKDLDVTPNIIHAGISEITVSDVLMASASEAIICGFKVKSSGSVNKSAEKKKVEILVFDIIYELLETIDKILLGMLEPEEIETVLGKIVIKGVFYKKDKEMTIGGKVSEGELEDNSFFRIYRKGEIIGQGEVLTLKRVAETVKMVEKGEECGMKVKTPKTIEEGDVLEVFKIEKKIRGEI